MSGLSEAPPCPQCGFEVVCPRCGIPGRDERRQLERQVWAAAYAAFFVADATFLAAHGREVSGVSGFSAAERADVAVEALREALVCDDAKYLIPVNEEWV